MPATLVLTRKNGSPVMEIHRGRFEILVDGARVGTVADRETFETPISSGSHALRVRTGRWGSRTAGFASNVALDEGSEPSC